MCGCDLADALSLKQYVALRSQVSLRKRRACEIVADMSSSRLDLSVSVSSKYLVFPGVRVHADILPQPEMIESFNVPKTKVAYWAGITSAVFSLSQCLTGIIWGRMSDMFGRKPAILAGMICAMTTSVIFGFSTTLPWAIVARALAGLGNGNVGIIRTTVAEMVPEKELQPRAFSVMPLVWTIGSIFGPAFGGALVHPAERHPELFGGNAFLKRYPFALPNLVACAFFLIGLMTGILFLKVRLSAESTWRRVFTVGRKLWRLGNIDVTMAESSESSWSVYAESGQRNKNGTTMNKLRLYSSAHTDTHHPASLRRMLRPLISRSMETQLPEHLPDTKRFFLSSLTSTCLSIPF